MTNCMCLRCLTLFGWVVIATVAVIAPVLSEDTANLQAYPVHLSCDLIDFGQIDDRVVSDYTFGITNSGPSQVQITGQLIDGPANHRFSLLGNTNGFDIEPGSTILVTIRYNPADQAGQDTAAWVAEVRSDSVWSVVIQLRGTAIDTIPPYAIGDLSVGTASENVGAGNVPSVDKSTHFALASVRIQNIRGNADLQLTSAGSANVQVEIVDSVGVPVKTFGLHEGFAGSQQFNWDLTDDSGRTLSIGKLTWRLTSARYIAQIDIIPNASASTSQGKMTD